MKRNIICIESEFTYGKNTDLKEFCSEPLLQYMKAAHGIDYIYRTVATEAELAFYLKKFGQKSIGNYGIFYFSFHGWDQQISLEGEPKGHILTLDRLAELSGRAFKDRYVHFSSCRTMKGSEKSLIDFKEKTGALCVSGYTKTVDSVLGSINDIAFFNEIFNYQREGWVGHSMDRMYSGLMAENGFKII